MASRKLPPFLADLTADRRSANALLAAIFALLAAGLDPKVLAPTAMSTQAAIRAQPQIEGQVLLVSVTTAILLLVGGAIGDTTRARPIMTGGLIVSFLAAFLAIFLQDSGLPFQIVRLLGIASSAFVMPCALALAATSYTGVARATAIGIAYAGYGLGQGLSPMMITLIPGTFTPAFLASMAGCAIALLVIRRRVRDLQRPTMAERPYVLGTALWAAGVVLFFSGLLWIGSGWGNELRWGFMIAGVIVVIVFFAWDRRRHQDNVPDVEIDRRPVTVALFVGLIVAMGQIIPMSQLPMYFGVILQFGGLGIVGMAPLFVALILAGPVAGFLLARFQPRHLIAGGMFAIGIGNLLVGLLIGPTSWYLAFILPLLLVGGGFVVATTVRTAVIFAAVPKGLPATAAALNEASIEVGNRIGIIIATVVITEISVFTLTSSLAGQSQAAIDSAVAQYREVLVALGTSSWSAVSGTVDKLELRQYAMYYINGVQVAMLAAGAVAVVGSIVAWVALGGGRALETVYDLRDERPSEELEPAIEVAPAG
jgi:MFS family permease